MSELTVRKVSTLPAGPWPSNILYIVDETGEISFHLSSSDGSELFSSLDDSTIQGIVDNSNHTLTVSTITARNNLVLTKDTFVKVTDATEDPNVTSGSAVYIYSVNMNGYTAISLPGTAGFLSSEEW